MAAIYTSRRPWLRPPTAESLTRPLVIAATAWALPVAMTILSWDAHRIGLVGLIAAAVSVALVLLRPEAFLVTLPFVTLFAPTAGFQTFGGFSLLLSDYFFVPVTLTIGLQLLQGRIPFSLGSRAAAWMAGWFAAGAMVAYLFGLNTSLKPLTYEAQLITILLYTRAYVTAPDRAWQLLLSWVIAIAMGACLVLAAYHNGIVLADFDVLPTESETPGIDRTQEFFQASYYYTNFHTLLGIGIVVTVIWATLFDKLVRKLLCGVAALLCFTALWVMINRTAIYAAVIACAASQCVVVLKLRRWRWGAAMVIALFALPFAFSVYDGFQSSVRMDRLTKSGTLVTRIEVLTQAFHSWSAHPAQLITGMGPDFLGDAGNKGLSRDFMYSTATRGEEGTVDSGWGSYLIELGCGGFFILLVLIRQSVQPVFHWLRTELRRDVSTEIVLGLFGAFVFLGISLFTQMLGYTKMSWLPFQLCLVGFGLARLRLDTLTPWKMPPNSTLPRRAPSARNP